MGEADAILLAGHGAKVVLGDIRDDRLEALAGRMAEGGGDVTYATTDVRRPEDLSLSELQACTIECHGSHKCISQPGRACGVGLSRSQKIAEPGSRATIDRTVWAHPAYQPLIEPFVDP